MCGVQIVEPTETHICMIVAATVVSIVVANAIVIVNVDAGNVAVSFCYCCCWCRCCNCSNNAGNVAHNAIAILIVTDNGDENDDHDVDKNNHRNDDVKPDNVSHVIVYNQ